MPIRNGAVMPKTDATLRELVLAEADEESCKAYFTYCQGRIDDAADDLRVAMERVKKAREAIEK